MRSTASDGNALRLRPLLLAGTVAALLLAGCGGADDVIDPEVRPIVERIRGAPTPSRWAFTYHPDSASPYLACLNGIDEASGTVDLETGIMFVRPDRDAPPIIVTNSSFMVATGTDPGDPWNEVRFGPEDDPAPLLPLFGEVLANLVATGIRAPDLNMTALAAIVIATAVEPDTPPAGAIGDTFRITVDPERYLGDLEANGVVAADGEQGRVPSFTVTADVHGRVTSLVVDASPTGAASGSADRYLVTATYETAAITVPARRDRRLTGLASLNYPTATTSCTFRP